MILSPAQYDQVSAFDLLVAAERGEVPLDHRLLHALADHPERTLPDLVRFAPQAGEITEDLLSIFQHMRAPEAVPFLTGLVREQAIDVSMPVIGALQAVGAPAVDALLGLYHEPDMSEETDVAFVLGSLGVRDPRILELLIARLETDPVDAAHCLAAYGDPSAIPAIEGAMAGAPEKWQSDSMRSCVERLRHGEPGVEDEPFDLWSLYPEKDYPSFDRLNERERIEFLASPEEDYRLLAVDAVSHPELPERWWDRIFEMARQDLSPRVRGRAWQALGDALASEEIRGAARARLADEAAPVEERCGILVGTAAREGDDPEVRRRMLEFYDIPEARARAMQAMACTGDPDFSSYFTRHLEDPDFAVRLQAIQGVGYLEIAPSAPRLIPYFDDEVLRDEAIPSYALAAPCKLTRAGLLELKDKIDRLAHGLSTSELEGVESAINVRLARNDMEPLFGPDGEVLQPEPPAVSTKVGRNQPCPCGSGKKYKKCCGA